MFPFQSLLLGCLGSITNDHNWSQRGSMTCLTCTMSEIMVWVRRMLWGWEIGRSRRKRKRRKTTMPFFSKHKVLLETNCGWPCAWVGWRQHVATMLLCMWSHSVLPQKTSVLWALRNYCGPRPWADFSQTGSCHIFHVHFPSWDLCHVLLDWWKVLLHCLAHGALQDLPFIPLGFLPWAPASQEAGEAGLSSRNSQSE